jgi:hypothetical protein
MSMPRPAPAQPGDLRTSLTRNEPARGSEAGTCAVGEPRLGPGAARRGYADVI